MGTFSYTDPLLSQKPSDDSSPEATMAFVLRQALQNLECCLPAEVKAYDREANIATVRPLIMKANVDGNNYQRSQIYKVNVLSLGGGGFHISFPLKGGDIGWIVAADRDLDLFKVALEESAPNTGRTHTFSDCWFVPDKFRKYLIDGEDGDRMVLQSDDSNARVAIGKDIVKITVGSSFIKLQNGQVNIETGTAEINAPQGTTINGDTKINGKLTVSDIIEGQAGISAAGNMTSQGSMSASGEGTFGGVAVSTHRHKDGQNNDCSTPIP
ncbi:baseplate spike protein [Aeromonas phage Gekk3-15]